MDELSSHLPGDEEPKTAGANVEAHLSLRVSFYHDHLTALEEATKQSTMEVATQAARDRSIMVLQAKVSTLA